MKQSFLALIMSALIVGSALAHPGGTDKYGGHYDKSTMEYHYHHETALGENPGVKSFSLSWDRSPSKGVVNYRVYHETFYKSVSREERLSTAFKYSSDSGNVTSRTVLLKRYSRKVTCFKVTALDAAGNESTFSNMVCEDDKETTGSASQ